VGDTVYLVADVSVECANAAWRNMQWVVSLIVIVFPIGVPLAFLILLFRYRRELHHENVRVALGFLYEGMTLTAEMNFRAL
jgi:hypothetical protein